MTSLTPFMARRARLLRQETQEQFATFLVVDPSTVSRWECGRLEPTPIHLNIMREVVRRYDPSQCYDFIERSPCLKYVCKYHDFKEGVTCSKGLLEAHGVTREELMENRDEFWTGQSDQFNTIVQANAQWQRGEIAFIETVHLAKLGWINAMGAPMEDTGTVLFEGVVIDEKRPHHPEKKFWVELYPFAAPKQTTRASHRVPN